MNYVRLSLFLCKTDMTTGLPGQITETTRWGQQTNLSALHVGCPNVSAWQRVDEEPAAEVTEMVPTHQTSLEEDQVST